MLEFIVACLVSFCVGFGANWALVYFQPPKTQIINVEQRTDVETTQLNKQEVFQGQVTITILDGGRAVSNINVNLNGVTNMTVVTTSRTNTNWTKTNN
jgi:hypothetical protein